MANGQAWCEQTKWLGQRREEWRYAYAGDKIVRYAEKPPLADLEGVLAYLKGASGCSKLNVDGKPVTGSWVTLRAYLDLRAKAGTDVAEPVLVHEIVPAGSSAADTAYVTENNCTFVVTLTPYFRQSAVGTVPAGSSGITYQIVGATRDREDGFWYYNIEKREQLTTTTGVVTLEDDAFKTVYGQTFLGVRTGNKDHTGASVALWPVNDDTPGTLVEEPVPSKNANCTVDITQRKTVAKADVTARTALDADVFRAVTGTTVENQAAADTAEVPASGGLSTAKTSDKNPDGTYRNAKTEEQERAVSEAVKTESDDAAEAVTQVENAGQAAAAALPETPTAGTLVEVTNTKTKGALFVQRVKTAVAKLWESRHSAVTRDIFETVTETHSDAVAEASLPEVPPAASGGTWYERIRIKRRDRLYDTREVKHEEQVVGSAEAAQTKTIFETVTESGSTAAASATADAAGSGRSHFLRWVLTRGGLYRLSTRTTQENTVTDSVRRVVKTPFEMRTVNENRSLNAPLSEELPAVGMQRENRKTAGGWYDTVNDVRTAVPDVTEIGLKTIEGLETRAETRTRNEAAAPTMPTAQTPGTVELVEYQLNDLGKYDVRRRTETGEKFVDTYSLPDERGTAYVTRYFNHTAAEEKALLAALDAGRSNSAAPGQINRFGKFDGVIVSRPATGQRGAGANFAWSVTGKTQVEKRIVYVDGVRKVQTITLTYSMKKDWGISGGAADYSGALMPGSFFHDLGNDWYFYKKVTGMTTSEAAYTPGGSL